VKGIDNSRVIVALKKCERARARPVGRFNNNRRLGIPFAGGADGLFVERV
jgi:hypothetical protein